MGQPHHQQEKERSKAKLRQESVAAGLVLFNNDEKQCSVFWKHYEAGRQEEQNNDDIIT